MRCWGLGWELERACLYARYVGRAYVFVCAAGRGGGEQKRTVKAAVRGRRILHHPPHCKVCGVARARGSDKSGVVAGRRARVLGGRRTHHPIFRARWSCTLRPEAAKGCWLRFVRRLGLGVRVRVCGLVLGARCFFFVGGAPNLLQGEVRCRGVIIGQHVVRARAPGVAPR